LKKLREEETGIAGDSENEDEDEAAWQGWDVETDSESDSESQGWIDVESDGEGLEVSDSEDEAPTREPTTTQQEGQEEQDRVSTLATTKVFCTSWVFPSTSV